MRTRISLAVAAALIVGGWIYWSIAATKSEAAPITLAEVGNVSNPATSEPTSQGAPDGVVQRIDISAAESAVVLTQPADEFDPSPVLVAPWLARILVVDDDQRPVADAKVTMWLAKKAKLSAAVAKQIGHDGQNFYEGRELEPIHELRTDASGRLQITLTHECVVAGASKDGYERSAEVSMWSARAVETETSLWLEGQVVLRGVVLGANGLPAANAVVTGKSAGISSKRQSVAPSPEPVTCDADGRFEMIVRELALYYVVAELDRESSLTERVFVATATPPDITLVFPGAIAISGTVFDVNGQPVSGAEVSAWREIDLSAGPNEGADANEHVLAKADESGRFSMAVRTYARYQLIGSAKGHANSSPVWTETTDVRPRAEVRIALLEVATIRGRVVREDGSAFAEVPVTARPESDAPSAPKGGPSSRDMFSRVVGATTDVDGKFELRVHPGTTWTLAAVPFRANYHLRIEQNGVEPGTNDVVLRFRDLDLAGCVVHGVVRRADGGEVGDYEIEIVTYEGDKLSTSGRSGVGTQIDGDRFTLPPLPLGKEFAIQVTPKSGERQTHVLEGSVAPAQQGPFVTDGPTISLEFVLEGWGEVPVRVLTSMGRPAQGLHVQVSPVVQLGFYRSGQPIDAEGKIVVQRCAPGVHHLRVWRDTQIVWEQELTIASGPNPEVVAHLPANPDPAPIRDTNR